MNFIRTSILLLATSLAFAKYGDQQTIKADSKIPKGWAIVEVKGASSMSMGAGGGKPSDYVIRNLNGAAYGVEEDVWVDSPVPDNWVVVKTGGGTSMGAGQAARPKRKTIKNLNE